MSPKHQVTLPTEVLARAGLKVGDRLEVKTNVAGEVVLTRVGHVLDSYAGSLPDVYAPGYLDELRREWA